MDPMTKEQHRWFLSDRIRKVLDWRKTDQNQGVRRIHLSGPDEWGDIKEFSLIFALFVLAIPDPIKSPMPITMHISATLNTGQ